MLIQCVLYYCVLVSIVNTPDRIKCVSLNNQQCMTQPFLFDLHSNKYIEGLRCYPFAVNLDRCMGSSNTLNDLSNKVCVPNKTEDLNWSVFNMITEMSRNIYKTRIM